MFSVILNYILLIFCIADGGALPKKSRVDFTEWEEDTRGPIMDEVQEYSSAVFHIDGSVEENLLTHFGRNKASHFQDSSTLPREFYAFQQQVRLASAPSVQQGAS